MRYAGVLVFNIDRFLCRLCTVSTLNMCLTSYNPMFDCISNISMTVFVELSDIERLCAKMFDEIQCVRVRS